VIKRIVLLLVVALFVVALSAPVALAKQATSGPQGTGQTTTYKGNSTNSQVDSCFQGAGSQNPC
jgi:capsular polysaccharide biosynthesis protein